jgi:hypothetical protein
MAYPARPEIEAIRLRAGCIAAAAGKVTPL